MTMTMDGHTISSTCEPEGSGELKNNTRAQISCTISHSALADQKLLFLLPS